ncbi:hypothetical protein [Streptacidiphilus jiangxiensis]|nr:hypothetical protein [Streptacidiphilus jiangxiensis]
MGGGFGALLFLMAGMSDGPGPKPSWPGLGVGAVVMLLSVGTLVWCFESGRRGRRARLAVLFSVAGAYLVCFALARLLLP